MSGQIAALLACALLAGLAVFQASLVAGLPLGRFAWGGQHEVLPTNLRIGSLISIGIYAVIALVLLEQAGLLALIDSPVGTRRATWALGAYFVVGTGMNAISPSKPERYTMTPIALALAVLCFVIAYTGGHGP